MLTATGSNEKLIFIDQTNMTEVEFNIKLVSPSDCRYAANVTPFFNMTNTITCTTTQPYTCSQTLPVPASYYVACQTKELSNRMANQASVKATYRLLPNS
jgi:Flp pilus assembly protein TadG